MENFRIHIDIAFHEGDVKPFVTVSGTESDATQLYQYLNGRPVSRSDGSPSTMTFRVRAEHRQPTRYEPVNDLGGDWDAGLR